MGKLVSERRKKSPQMIYLESWGFKSAGRMNTSDFGLIQVYWIPGTKTQVTQKRALLLAKQLEEKYKEHLAKQKKE